MLVESKSEKKETTKLLLNIKKKKKKKKRGRQRTRRCEPLINISSLSPSSSFSSSFSSSVISTTSDAPSSLSEQFSPPTCTHAPLFAQAKEIIVIRSLLTNTWQRRELLVPAELIDEYVSVRMYGCFGFKSHLHTSIP